MEAELINHDQWMKVFFRFGFGQLIAQDLSGSQAAEETNVTPALDCFLTEPLCEAAEACRIYQAVGKPSRSP